MGLEFEVILLNGRFNKKQVVWNVRVLDLGEYLLGENNING